MESRQRQVVDQEELLEKAKINLAEEFDRKMLETREASRRMREEHQHQLHLGKNQQKDAEDRLVFIV